MNLTDQARRSVEQLADDLVRDGQLSSCNKTSLRGHFDEYVNGLKDDNPELMLFLRENRRTYSRMLVQLAKAHRANTSQLKNALSNGQQNEFQPLPFNLFKSKKIKKNVIEEHYSDHQSIYSTYLYERLNHLQETSKVLKLLKQCQKSTEQLDWTLLISKMSVVVNMKNDAKSLQVLMDIFNSKLTEELENGDLDEDRLNVIKSAIEDFITFCSRKEMKEFPTKPKYDDLLAAIVSMYADVVLSLNRNKSEAIQVKEGNRLCGFVCFIFRQNPEFLLDVLIQVSQPSDGLILLPLCKKALKKPDGNVEPVFYTKYVVAARQYKRKFPELLPDVIAEVQTVTAPAAYVEWLSGKNEALVELLPAKSSRITKFLLNKASDDLIENLLDILTSADGMEAEPAVEMEVNQLQSDVFCLDRGRNAAVETVNTEEEMEVEEQEDIDQLEKNREPDENVTLCIDHKQDNETDVLTETDDADSLFCVDRGDDTEMDHKEEPRKEIEVMPTEPVEAHIDVSTKYSVVEISGYSVDEEEHEKLIDRVIKCIEDGITSDTDMFDEFNVDSKKKISDSQQKKSIHDDDGDDDASAEKKRQDDSHLEEVVIVDPVVNDALEEKETITEQTELPRSEEAKNVLQYEKSTDESTNINICSPTKSRKSKHKRHSAEGAAGACNGTETEVMSDAKSEVDIQSVPRNSQTEDIVPSQNVVPSQNASGSECEIIEESRSPRKLRKNKDEVVEVSLTKEETSEKKTMHSSEASQLIKSPKNMSIEFKRLPEISPEKENKSQDEILEDSTCVLLQSPSKQKQADQLADKVLNEKEMSTPTKTFSLFMSPKCSSHERKRLRRKKSVSPRGSLNSPRVLEDSEIILNTPQVSPSADASSQNSESKYAVSLIPLPNLKKFIKSSDEIAGICDHGLDVSESPILPFTRIVKYKEPEQEKNTSPVHTQIIISDLSSTETNSTHSEVFQPVRTYSHSKRIVSRKDLEEDAMKMPVIPIDEVLQSPRRSLRLQSKHPSESVNSPNAKRKARSPSVSPKKQKL